jgi:hypothetical protein
MWTVGRWLLEHDNAPAHTALSDNFWQISTLPQSTSSRDLSPPDYFPFHKLKVTLKGDTTNIL